MAKIDITKGVPDLEVDEIRVLWCNSINRARVKLLKRRKADHNDNGMICLSCGDTVGNEEKLYIEDKKHAKLIIQGIELAMKLKWFQGRR